MNIEGKIFDSMYGELEAADRENFVLMQYTGLKDWINLFREWEAGLR